MKNGIDISLKALQEYATEKGIVKKVDDMSFTEKNTLRGSKIVEETRNMYGKSKSKN